MNSFYGTERYTSDIIIIIISIITTFLPYFASLRTGFS